MSSHLGTNRLSGPMEMSHFTKLIDEHHQWCETGSDVRDKNIFTEHRYLGNLK
jgi:hypothetical protein